MAQYIEKDKIEEILRNLWKQDDGHNPEHRICYNKALQKVQCEIDSLEVKEIKDNSLEKFKSLQHISGDLKSTLQDGGYAPSLYYFDGSWHVDWISCEEGDSIKYITTDTAEEAINEAYNWFHSTFCNG